MNATLMNLDHPANATLLAGAAELNRSPQFDSVEDILADIRAGKMVILMDDEDRENEGDLVMAAEFVRPEDINFMARYARGLICLTLSAERCRTLRLPQMVRTQEQGFGTAFTVSIEAAEGVTTGISAYDRAHTIRTAVRKDARAEDLVQPGHIFPLMAQPGGVLTRAGHTEAGCDLARMAGCEPAAAICEILNEDGTMARRPDLEKFAREHGLKIGTIADLIRYRLTREHSIERVAENKVKTEFGEFHLMAYQDQVDGTLHLAMVKGTIDPSQSILVRVHIRNTLSDVLGVEHPDFSWPLRAALKRISEEPCGVVLLLRKPESAQELVRHIVGLNLGRSGEPASTTTDASDQRFVLRTYGIGAQILTDLGVRKMRVLSSARRLQGISGFDLEITEYVPCR